MGSTQRPYRAPTVVIRHRGTGRWVFCGTLIHASPARQADGDQLRRPGRITPTQTTPIGRGVRIGGRQRCWLLDASRRQTSAQHRHGFVVDGGGSDSRLCATFLQRDGNRVARVIF